MRQRGRSLILFLLVCSSTPMLRAQDEHAADSLWNIWKTASAADTTRLKALIKFVNIRFWNSDPDSTAFYGRIILDEAREKGLKKFTSSGLMLMARGAVGKGELDTALVYYRQAFTADSAIGERQGMAKALNNLSLVESDRGDYASAIDHLTRSLRISEEINDSSMIARTLGNIGVLYDHQQDTANAMDYYQRRLAIAEALQQKDILSEVIMNIANIHTQARQYDRALVEYERCLALTREIGYGRMEVLCLRNMAMLHDARHERTASLELVEQALAIAQKIGDRVSEADSYTDIANAHMLMGDPRRGLPYARKGLAIAQEVGNVVSTAGAAGTLYEILKKLDEPREALAMHELYVTLRDSISKDENKQAIMQQKFQYDYDKKEVLLKAEQGKKDAVAAEELRRRNVQRNAFIGGFALMVLLAGNFLTQRNRIGKEKKRSEVLLLNILPEEVANELKLKGEAEAKHFDNATILFTDFKGFTTVSEQLSPRELVEELNTCFKAFDHIITARGIEKIKTIGDAYMCAGGLPDPASSSPTAVVQAALEMQAFMIARKTERDAQNKPAFEMRVGIHTGPVVAGIVGVKKFAYDIWGDTVNTASRMESSSEVGQVNISEATYALVKETTGLSFTPRGKVQAKGKGEMEMYFVSAVPDESGPTSSATPDP